MRRRANQPGKGLRRVAGSSPTSTQARLGLRPPGLRPPVPARDGKKPVRRRWDWTQVPLMLTALAAVGALVFTALSLQATREGQLTDRFSKAVEQLGTEDSLEVRLGGIYALERIAFDSARDHPVVMEVLSAYVREHAPLPMCTSTASSEHPATDVQAILTVLARRDQKRDDDALDLNNTCLRSAVLGSSSLVGADLGGTDLSGAHLAVADLSGANLSGADLGAADLTTADLTTADLSGALFDVANLDSTNVAGADLTHAHLERANLTSANLTSANLTYAYLERANLTSANLTAANLTAARLIYANLTDADLTGARLIYASLTAADLTRTRGL